MALAAGRASHQVLAILTVLALLGMPLAAAPPPPANPHAEGFRARNASGVELHLGPTLLRFETGTFFIVDVPQDTTFRVVFVGRAVARFLPRDPVERRQMMLFTGFPGLLEAFHTAVFVLGPGPIPESIERCAPLPPTPEYRQRARNAWKAWLVSPERRLLPVEKLRLRTKYGSPLAGGTVIALIEGETLGTFTVRVEPEYQEALTLGDVTTWDRAGHRRKEVRHLLKAGFGLYDLDREEVSRATERVWVSAGLDGTTPPPIADEPVFRVSRLSLDAALKGHRLEMSVTAAIGLRAARDGVRILELRLPSPAKDLTVLGPRGHSLPVVASPPRHFVVLPSPMASGETSSITVTYRMGALEHTGRKSFAMANPGGWVPWIPGPAPEKIQVTMRWPKRFELFTPGTKTAGDRVSGGTRIRSFVLKPAESAVPFVIGDFDVRKATVHGQEIVAAADRTARKRNPSAADDTLRLTKEILEALRKPFGPLPFGHLTVVTTDSLSSWSVPGFIVLASSSVEDRPELRNSLGINSTPEGYLAYSVAQQWLSNAVRWAITRDAWWSFAAPDYAAHRIMPELESHEHRMVSTSSPGRRIPPERLLLTDGTDPRTLASPVLDERILNNPSGLNGFLTVVQNRGAQILGLLDASAPDRDLLPVLGQIVRRHRGERITTETMLDEIGAALELEPWHLAKPFLDGRPTPAVAYDWVPGGNPMTRWTISGGARPCALVPMATVELDGAPDRPFVEPLHTWRISTIRPPFGILYGVLGKVPADGAGERARGSKLVADFGTLGIDEPITGFHLPVPFPATSFYLDPLATTPLVTVSQTQAPLYYRLCQGIEQAAEGSLERAAGWFREVTETCSHLDPEHPPSRENQSQCAVGSMAAHVHLGEIALAWSDLDQAVQHLAEAREALARVQKLHPGIAIPSPPSITVLAARIDLARGDATTARARLSALSAVNRQPLTPDGYAVLAVAAARSGHPLESAHAWQAARSFGLVPNPAATVPSSGTGIGDPKRGSSDPAVP